MIIPSIEIVTDIKTNENIVKIEDINEIVKIYFKDKKIYDIAKIEQYGIIKNISDFFSIDVDNLLYLKNPKNDKLKKYIYNNLHLKYRKDFDLYFLLFSLKDFDELLRDEYLYYIINDNIFLNLNFEESSNFYCIDDISYVVCEFLLRNNIINDYYNFTKKDNEIYFFDKENNTLIKYIKESSILTINVDNYDINDLEYIKNEFISIIGNNYVLGNIFYSILDKHNTVVLDIDRPSDEDIFKDYDKIKIDNFNNINYNYLFKYFELGKDKIKPLTTEELTISKSDILERNDKYIYTINYMNTNDINKLIYKLISEGVVELSNNDIKSSKDTILALAYIFVVWSESLESLNAFLFYLDFLIEHNRKYKYSKTINNSLKVFKIFIYKSIISQYDRFIDKKDYLFLYKNYIIPFEKLNKNYYKIGKKEIKELNECFGFSFTSLFKMKNIGNEVQYTFPIFNYTNNAYDQEPIINFNLSSYVYSLSYLSYRVSRELTSENNKWYKNNIIIENILEYLNYYINLLMKNKNNINSIIFRRIISLVSTYYNLKIRYNIDNDKNKIEYLIDQYLEIISEITLEKKYFIHIITASKLIEEFYKIQNFYNYFDINKNIVNNKVFISFFKEYTSVFMDTFIENEFYDINYFYENIHLHDNDMDNKGNGNSYEYRVHNYYRAFDELIRPFTQTILLRNNKYFEYEDVAFFESKINYIKNGWNTHVKNNKYHKNMICKNNFIDLGFIYE